MSTETTAPAETGKTHADVGHLLRAIERAIIYRRLPAPIAVNIQREYRAVKLRFDAADDVRAWAEPTGATVVIGRHVFDRATHKPWHEVGTEQGGRAGALAGWQVSMWASVDGLPLIEGPKSWTCPYCTFTTTDIDAGMAHIVDREQSKGCVTAPQPAADVTTPAGE